MNKLLLVALCTCLVPRVGFGQTGTASTLDFTDCDGRGRSAVRENNGFKITGPPYVHPPMCGPGGNGYCGWLMYQEPNGQCKAAALVDTSDGKYYFEVGNLNSSFQPPADTDLYFEPFIVTGGYIIERVSPSQFRIAILKR